MPYKNADAITVLLDFGLLYLSPGLRRLDNSTPLMI